MKTRKTEMGRQYEDKKDREMGRQYEDKKEGEMRGQHQALEGDSTVSKTISASPTATYKGAPKKL